MGDVFSKFVDSSICIDTCRSTIIVRPEFFRLELWGLGRSRGKGYSYTEALTLRLAFWLPFVMIINCTFAQEVSLT